MTYILVFDISFEPINRFSPDFHQNYKKISPLKPFRPFLKSRSTHDLYLFAISFEPINRFTPDFHQNYTKLVH